MKQYWEKPNRNRVTMKDETLGKKVARTAMGYERVADELIPKKTRHTARVLHEVDKRTSRSKIVEMFEESEAYIDNLVGFHKDAMEFLRSLDVYSTSDRLDKVKQLQTLMEQGEALEEHN